MRSRFWRRGGLWLAINVAILIPIVLTNRETGPWSVRLGTAAILSALLSTLLTVIALGLVVPSGRFVIRLARRDAEAIKSLRNWFTEAAGTAMLWVLLGLFVVAVAGVVHFSKEAKGVLTADDPMSTLIDRHPYFAIYLLGCVAAAILLTIKVVVFWGLAWVTKSNVLAANLKKLEPKNPRPIWSRAIRAAGGFVLEALVSWINVAVIAWQIVRECFRALREALSSVPESIRELRFPLRSNPELPAESVWAYLCALSVRAGAPVDEMRLKGELDDLSAKLPTFNRARALAQLERLDVLSPPTVAALRDSYLDSEPSVV